MNMCDNSDMIDISETEQNINEVDSAATVSKPKCDSAEKRCAEDFSESRNPIYKYFSKHIVPLKGKEYSFGKCNECASELKMTTGQTTSLSRHLQGKHFVLYNKWKQENESWLKLKKLHNTKKARASEIKTQSSPKQATLKLFFSGTPKKWSKENPKSKMIDKQIARFIVKGNHPYSIVEEPEFKDLMNMACNEYHLPGRNYFSQKIIPALYSNVRQNVTDTIQLDLAKEDIASLCFTSDIWTSNANESYISLTVQYALQDFSIQKFLLNNSYFPGTHDSTEINRKLKDLLHENNLMNTTIPIYIATDNAGNISNAVKIGWNHVGCFVNKLQLVISDAKKLSPNFDKFLSKCHSIVGHFKHSCQATERLHALQKMFDANKKCLDVIQDVSTRWNSEFLMLERLTVLRRAISSELASNSKTKLQNLNAVEWDLAESYVEVLRPLYLATTEVCKDKQPTLSMVFPIVQGLKLATSKFVTTNAGRAGVIFARNLSKALEADSRFPKTFLMNLENNTQLLSMLLDPRFKDLILSEDQKLIAKDRLKDALHECSTDTSLLEVKQVEDAREEVEDGTSNPLWESFDAAAAVARKSSASDHQCLLILQETQIQSYLSEKTIPRSKDPYAWWRENINRFYSMKKAVRKYLVIPATSAASERVFSQAGNIVTSNRSRLSEEKVEQLLYLHENLH